MPPNQKSKKFDFLVGLSIDGYTLLELVGHGHYGAVFRASEPRKQANVAVKVLRAPKPGSSKEALLGNELEALRRLRTSRTATYLHQVAKRDGLLFLVMNFCDGGDLWNPIMRDRRFVGNSALVSRVFVKMLDAVQDAHNVDFAHRDVKPENFLCDADLDRVWLADFGLATEGRHTGKFGRGTPAYLPPEGWLPKLESIDAFRGDVFALGVTLFQMLYGEYPWCRAVPNDRHWDDFVSFRVDFFENCDRWAGMRGGPPLSPEAHSLLSAALEPEMDARMDVAEFKRRFQGIDQFFSLPKTASSDPHSIVEVQRTPSLSSDNESEPEYDAGPATPGRMPSPEVATGGIFKFVYGESERGPKVRQPSTGIRAWLRRLVIRQSSSASR
ncbi:kinase-like protein [Peniophora sp. CONT]|nr:kinase-like protein [Peniophora sp. CONT]